MNWFGGKKQNVGVHKYVVKSESKSKKKSSFLLSGVCIGLQLNDFPGF